MNFKKLRLVINPIPILLIIILIISGCKMNEEYDMQLEGLSYKDLTPIRIGIVDGKIKKVEKIHSLPEEAKNLIIAPGLIDTQVNGYFGLSFVNTGGDLTMEGIQTIIEKFWEVGTTSIFPTLTTNLSSIIVDNLKLLTKAKNSPQTKGSIAGFHLEGPYISPEDGYRGAHPLIYVKKPDWNEFMKFYEAADKNIKLMTLAPEIEGAMEFIGKCKDLGISVSMGHHNANREQINEAVEQGASLSTHLGNAIANYIHRWNNPLWPQLANDNLSAGLIIDGFHLTPEQVKVFFKAKGEEKIIMVSDMSSLGGLKPGYYLNAIGDSIEVKAEGVIVYPKNQSLSGAASPLSKMIHNAIDYTGCSLATAIDMASANPANFFGLNDRGKLEPGLRADIIMFTLDNQALSIKRTVVAGEVVYEAK